MQIRDYIEHLRAKPEHVRRGIALGTSAGITALVVVGYLAALGSSGALALNQEEAARMPTFAEMDISNELLGAASAFRDAASGEGVQVVETESDTTFTGSDTGDGRTVIPF